VIGKYFLTFSTTSSSSPEIGFAAGAVST
jgi:hypothetical protein